jgi:hypothetical protein
LQKHKPLLLEPLALALLVTYYRQRPNPACPALCPPKLEARLLLPSLLLPLLRLDTEAATHTLQLAVTWVRGVLNACLRSLP